MARPRKHKLDENYFSTIDNTNKAYILGFLYADGSISKNYNITVCISKKDIEILEFIKKELKYSGDITTKIISQNEYSLLRIVSKKLSIDLIKLGILNNKTYESKQLPTIPNKYFNDLLRGFFDGDGSIYKNGDNGFGMSFSSNIYVLKQIKQYLKENNIKSSKIRLKNDSIYSGLLEVKGSLQIEKLKNLLFYENCFSLSRKVEKFLEFEKYIQGLQKRKLNEEVINSIKEKYNHKLSQKQIALELDMPYSSVRTVVQRLRKNKQIT